MVAVAACRILSQKEIYKNTNGSLWLITALTQISWVLLEALQTTIAVVA